MRYPADFIDKVREASDVVEIISGRPSHTFPTLFIGAGYEGAEVFVIINTFQTVMFSFGIPYSR